MLVAVGTLFSTFWILVTNSWMQTPAGYKIVNGIARTDDLLYQGKDLRVAVADQREQPRLRLRFAAEKLSQAREQARRGDVRDAARLLSDAQHDLDQAQAELHDVNNPSDGLNDCSVLPPTISVSKRESSNGSVSTISPADVRTGPPFSERK